MTRASDHKSLRQIPSVDQVLRDLGETGLPRPIVLAIARRELAAIRESGSVGNVLAVIRAAIGDVKLSRMQSVINGTGIIIHTNFGRSPMGPAVVAAVAGAASVYSNLEFDLASGERGVRAGYVEFALATLCHSQAATVVNNCAAALILVVQHFAARPPKNRVIISRGELIQIGGGFRIPEILEAAGASLCEVGTTNRTTLEDYRHAIDDRTAMILRVHQSNFFMDGFVGSPTTAELAALAQDRRIPFAVDLGSGATFETADINSGECEPTPADTFAAGASVVMFSSDKLLGGPQAGIIAGAVDTIAALKREPLFRALRCDKLILAGLEKTVDLLLDGRFDQIPVRAMIDISTDALRERAVRIVAALGQVPCPVLISEGDSRIGGGALPRSAIPSITIDLPHAPPRWAERLRAHTPAVVGYIAADTLKFDLRTIFPNQDEQLIAAIRAVTSEMAER